MKPAALQTDDEVQSMVHTISRCLHRVRLEELGRLSRQLLGVLARNADHRRAAFQRFLGLIETGVRSDDLPLTVGAYSALSALAADAPVALAVRFGGAALLRAA
jgi:hypothetical protein